ATKIFRHSEEMIQFLKTDTVEFIKIIKIGTVPWLSKDQTYSFLKPLILSKHIKIEVYQKDLDALIKDVQNNRLDVILCDSPYSGRSKKLMGHRLTTDPIICVCSPSHRIKGKFPNSLNGQKIINYSEACMMAEKIENFFSQNKIKSNIVGSFTDSSLIRVTIENGNVIGFLPQSVVKQSLKNKSLKKLGELEKVKFSLWAITRKDYKKDGLIANTLKRSIK
ncbi:LysR family transcriptional regulator substrate-binding protein, partial [Bacteriovoracaceae bacterium]|nr:LysR family transcriptional regulator substrate-binding protein [Bacteriovoracaceae bacterium]